MDKYLALAVFFLLLFSCKKEATVFNGTPNENFELPLILKLNGKECFYDETTGLLKYSLIENESDNFSPFIEFQEYSTVFFNGVELKNNEINNIEDIELNKRYSLDIVTNGETRHLQLEFTNIPLIRIVTFDKISNEPKTLAKMTVNYPESLKEAATDWIGIELRGASSLKYDKNSFGIDIYSGKSTDDHVSRSYFDLKRNSKWILDAMYIDKARCRKKVSGSLWESTSKTGYQTTVRSVYTEVFLNNKSLGLYCFTENYSKEFLNLNSQSVLYKGIDNSVVTFFNQLPDNNPTSSKWADWEQKFPYPSERIVWGDFKSLSELIVNGSDAAFTESIESMINLDNVIDYYLFINLCGGADNLGKNWQFLKYSPTDKFIIVPWDLDATWGRNAVGGLQTFENHLTNRLFDRLRSSNPGNYNERLRQRWQQLRSEQFSESHLIALFSDNFSSLQHSTILETENRLYQQSLNLEQEQAYIATWIINRLHYLDELFQ